MKMRQVLHTNQQRETMETKTLDQEDYCGRAERTGEAREIPAAPADIITNRKSTTEKDTQRDALV